MPMMSMQTPCMSPPTIVEVVLPHLSARRKAGMVAKRMTRPETPEAKKDAVLLVRPADWNRRGA